MLWNAGVSHTANISAVSSDNYYSSPGVEMVEPEPLGIDQATRNSVPTFCVQWKFGSLSLRDFAGSVPATFLLY